MSSLPNNFFQSNQFGPVYSTSKVNYDINRLKNLKKQQPPKEPFIIGVAGGTASGKTTVCQQIVDRLEDKRVVVISQDSFYKSLNEEQRKLAAKSEYNFDHPGIHYFIIL